MKNQLMIDLETMGTRPGSVIMSIGAIAFDLKTGELGEQFYRTIDLQSSLEIGLTVDPATESWWAKQDPAIHARMFKDTAPVKEVLAELCKWISQLPSPVCPWGNSAAFDLGLLADVLEKCGLPLPWNYYNERCCRTIVALNPGIKYAMAKPSAAHDPIEDCKYQIRYVTKIVKSLNCKL